MLPEADVAFLDEVFFGSTAILNTLLWLLNERQFRRGATSVRVPLRVCVGASNALPEEPALVACTDRFLASVFVTSVPDSELETLLTLGLQPAPMGTQWLMGIRDRGWERGPTCGTFARSTERELVMRKAFLGSLCLALSIALSSRASFAQDAAPPPAPSEPPARPSDAPPQPATPHEPAAKMDLSTAANGPAVPRTYHVHEGFYLRATVGLSFYKSSFTDNKRGGAEYTDSGSSLPLDVLVGGSPNPGLVIGGAGLTDQQAGDNILLGPFIDGFPAVNKGWHLGGAIGLGLQSFRNTAVDERQFTHGVGGALWFGYDFWTAGEWAIGPQVRFLGLRTKDTQSGEDVSVFTRSISFGLSGVYN